MTIVDCHCHIYPEKIAERAVEGVHKFYDIEMQNSQGTTQALLDTCEGSTITHHVVCSVATRPHQVQSINNFIAEECAAHPNLIGFMTLHQDFEDPETEIERAINLGLTGIKLHPDSQGVNADDPRLMRIYEIAQAKHLPVMLHCGDYRYDFTHPRRTKHVLQTFPDLAVNAAHFGGWSVFDLALEYLENENCFLDMSSSMAFLGDRRTRELVPYNVRQRFSHVEPRS